MIDRLLHMLPVVEDIQMNETVNRTTQQHFVGKSITYHPALDSDYDYWAEACGREPQSLRHVSEHAIRTRHHEAIIEDESNRACGDRPDVYTLSLGSVAVFYSVEESTVMIRGYCWELDREPLDDHDGGGFYI
jgi:hypothetical protein